MAETKDLGRLYLTRVPYLDKSSPWVEKGWSTETDYPWRNGKCIAFRVPFTKFGAGIGWWGASGDEDTNLTKAAGVRFLGELVDGEFDDELL